MCFINEGFIDTLIPKFIYTNGTLGTHGNDGSGRFGYPSITLIEFLVIT